jgi:diguanylate cyclase (GGDEF)-like protein/PAS domain S-box-containing protein
LTEGEKVRGQHALGGRERLSDSVSPATLSDRSAATMIELTADLACVVGFDGRIQQATARLRSGINHAIDQLIGEPYIAFVHPDDRADTQTRLGRLEAGQTEPIEVDNRFHRGDGSYRWLRWRVAPVRDHQVLYCLAHDIAGPAMTRGIPTPATEQDFVFSPKDAFAVIDADGVFTSMSPASISLLGYAPPELIGRRMTRLIHRDDRALARAARARMAHTGDIESMSLRLRRKDATYAWLECRSRPILDPETGAVDETHLALRDIGDRVEAQLEMERSALTDTLTGLANRTLLADRLSQALRRLKRHVGVVGVLMLDVDHFKVINDTLGHQIGDAVLMGTARRLLEAARPDDTVARFGGDEFVVVIQGLTTPTDLSACAERIVVALREPHLIQGEEVVATVSIGVAATSRPDHLPADLLREADLAMYRAKDRGRDRHEVYGEALQARAEQRLTAERILRHATAERRFSVEYQPIIDLESGMAVEAEALLRSADIDLGRSMPQHVLSVAEESGLLPTIDEWVRTTVFTDLAAWRRSGACRSLQRVAVNVTARELVSADFPAGLAKALREAGLCGRDLAIEVTEQALLQTSHSAIRSLVELRAAGVRIGLDDFGTGFSSLAHLQSFPLDFLKIDRSFVERMEVDKHSASIVAAIIHLAHALDLTVVAEGLASDAQLAALRGFGCDRGQGFLFARSLSPTALARFPEVWSSRGRVALRGVSRRPNRRASPIVIDGEPPVSLSRD